MVMNIEEDIEVGLPFLATHIAIDLIDDIHFIAFKWSCTVMLPTCNLPTNLRAD